MTYNTWDAVATCLNTDAHGHIHELMGGSWGHKRQDVSNSSYQKMATSLMSTTLQFVHVTQVVLTDFETVNSTHHVGMC